MKQVIKALGNIFSIYFKVFGGFWLLALIVYLLIMVPISYWTQSNLEYIISYFKHTPVVVPYWVSFILSAIGNMYTIFINIIVELLKVIL